MSRVVFDQIADGLREAKEFAATDAPKGKGSEAVASAAPIQDFAMLNVVEAPAPGKAAKVRPGINKTFFTKSDTAKAAEWLNAKLADAAGSVCAQVVDLTPALATVLLERNVGNRKLKEARVAAFAKDMVTGDWKVNGETIVVSADGLLNDGQHRCAAVVESGKTIQTMLVVGVDRGTRDTLDHGTGRTPGDDLALHGLTNGVQVASASRFLWMWRTYGFVRAGGSQAPTRSELIHVALDNPGLAKSLNFVQSRKAKQIPVGSVAVLGFAHFAFKTVSNNEAANFFFDCLLEGANLNRGDPILYTRNRLIAERSLLNSAQKIELLFRGWNAHRKGETRVLVRLTGGELPLLED